MSEEFSVRSLVRADELSRIIDLQAAILGDEDADMLPLNTLIDFARNGGQIVGAFKDKLLIGFLVAFLGTDSRDPHRPAMANLKLVLDRIGVHPDYRGVGVGMQMALRMRDISVKQGIRLATCAFDPVDSRMAYLLIRKLGATVNSFLPEYYGTEDDDRLLAEWWVTRNRVEERLFGQRGQLSLKHYLEAETPILNPSRSIPNSVQVRPFVEQVAVPETTMLLVEIPVDYAAIAHSNSELLSIWRQHVRDALLTVIDYGYVVTDFLYEIHEGRQRAFYLLSYNGPRLSIEI